MGRFLETTLDLIFGASALTALAIGTASQLPRLVVDIVKEEIVLRQKKS